MGIVDRSAAIFAGYSRIWQFAHYSIGAFLGSVAATNSRYRFLMDLLERSHFLRLEQSALTGLLLKKGLITLSEWDRAVEEEIALYEGELKKQWPEVTPAEDGRSYSLDSEGFAKRCESEKWPP